MKKSVLSCGWCSLSLLSSPSFESAPFGVEQIFALVKKGQCLGGGGGVVCLLFWGVWDFFCDWKAQTEVFWDFYSKRLLNFIHTIQNFIKKQAFLFFRCLTSIVLWYLC